MKSRAVIFAITVLFLSIQPIRAFAAPELPQNAPSQNAGPTAGQRKAGEVVIEPASVATPDTGNIDFELGTMFVPENRADPKSRLIGVGFARFRALRQTGAPPTFHLPGGPGYSYLWELKQTKSTALPRLLKYVNLFRNVSDVIFIDQRGNSERGEVLKFRYRTPEFPLDQPASLARSTAAAVERARAAVTEFAAKGIDLRGDRKSTRLNSSHLGISY